MTDRKLAAKLAEKLYSEEIKFEEFMMEYPDENQDDDLYELYDLIEHQPAISRFLGESQNEHDNRLKKINELIKKLKE